jgi:mono/diheme cytochrome c family protein
MLVWATAACGSGHATRPPEGRALFASACGACHTLSGVSSPAHQGGDLLGFHLSRQALLQFAREMPLRRPLTRAQLATVTRYIFALQQRSR